MNQSLPKRRRVVTQQSDEKRPSIIKKILLGMSISIVSILTIWFFLMPSRWDKETRFIVSILKESGDVAIAIFDPSTNKIVTIDIPKNTQVTVSRNLGTWKMGSIKKLGYDEKIPGILAIETIIKSFHIPSDAWSEEALIGLTSSSPTKIIQALGTQTASNVTLKEKIELAFFSLRVNPAQKYQLDPIDLGFLIPSKLKDGEEGYIPRSSLPSEIASFVVDPEIVERRPKITLIDKTGSGNKAKEVVDAVESLGGKILAITDSPKEEIDCMIKIKDKAPTKKLIKILNCPVNSGQPTGNFDIEIIIGEKFAKRY